MLGAANDWDYWPDDVPTFRFQAGNVTIRLSSNGTGASIIVLCDAGEKGSIGRPSEYFYDRYGVGRQTWPKRNFTSVVFGPGGSDPHQPPIIYTQMSCVIEGIEDDSGKRKAFYQTHTVDFPGERYGNNIALNAEFAQLARVCVREAKKLFSCLERASNFIGDKDTLKQQEEVTGRAFRALADFVTKQLNEFGEIHPNGMARGPNMVAYAGFRI